MKPSVLVVDDKPNFLKLVRKILARDAVVVTAGGAAEALSALRDATPDAVLCDLRMPDGDGLEVLRALRASGASVPFILMTAYATVPTAVAAMREGAYDYVTKPFDAESLRQTVVRALREHAQRAKVSEAAIAARSSPPPETSAEGATFGALLGRSRAMRELFNVIDRVAPSNATVLITGETGTGKELVAQELHRRSPRAARRLIAVNCAAIPPSLLESELFGHTRGAFTGAHTDRAGLFEEADGSTLLLDEIGELRPTLQAKLTRVLEERAIRRIGESRERRVDVRLVAATHRDLKQMARSREFREDLMFRLDVCPIAVPPLRDRPDDIPLLASYFLSSRGQGTAKAFSAEVLVALSMYEWPGNVRELRSVVERASIMADGPLIGLGDLPAEFHGVPDRFAVDPSAGRRWAEMTYREATDLLLEQGVRRYLHAVLARHHGNVTAAAGHAGVERESFHRLLRRHGVAADEHRPRPRDREPDEGESE